MKAVKPVIARGKIGKDVLRNMCNNNIKLSESEEHALGRSKVGDIINSGFYYD